MELESQQPKLWEGYVDWRNRPAVRGQHGGMFAATFVLAAEVLENLAFLANASNLVVYLAKYMHMSPAKSANSVTNFMGTAFLLALLGGFLSDAFFTTYHIYLLSALIEFLGLIILTVQAQLSSLRPPECDGGATSGGILCREVHGSKAAMLFFGLYLAALGVGGIKGSLPSHGAEQLDESTPKGRKQRSTFFNYFVFCLSCGGLIAVTLVVWIEDNKGWQWGFGISTFTVLLSIPIFLAGSPTYRNKIPSGSPLTTIAKVTIAAITSTGKAASPSNGIAMNKGEGKSEQTLTDDGPKEAELTESLGFLNRAALNKPVHAALHCSVTQVEDVKIVLKIVPIFCCTIMLNCCLAQLSTFSVQQAATMDTKLGSLTVPPASLPVFPILFIMLLAPIYDHLIIPFFRKLTKSEMGISHLRRIGVGLVLSVIAMATAALVEIKRKRVAETHPNAGALPITFLWIAFQYLFLGSADLFTLAGLLEFFFTEAPEGMKSLATALSFASLAMGYYLSSVIVSIVNTVTGHAGRRAWLSGESLEEYHLDLFYWLLCVLSTLNLLHYLLWSCKLYEYRSRPTITTTVE